MSHSIRTDYVTHFIANMKTQQSEYEMELIHSILKMFRKYQ